MQQVANRYITAWELHHQAQGSGDKIAEYLRALKEWHRADKAERGAKPKCHVALDDQELQKVLYEAVKEQGAQINSRVGVLLMNWLHNTLKTSNSGLPIWMNALLYRDRAPRFTKPIPIPIDGSNAKLEIRQPEPVEGKKLGAELWCVLRVDRVPAERGRATSTADEVRLVAGGKVSRYAAPLWKLAESKGKIKGSKLKWDETRRKWFLSFSVDIPGVVAENVDTDVVAVVYPSQLRPLKIRVGGRSRWISDKGYHVAMKRGMLQKQRLSRQRNYRTGIGRGKGGGRQRALASWEGKLERHWRMFCKTHNHHWANSAVTSAIEHGAGTSVFIQPSRGDRFLDVAGNIQPNKSGWPWYELGTLISQKGSRLGLKVKVVDELRARRCARP